MNINDYAPVVSVKAKVHVDVKSFFFLYGLEYDVFWSKTDGPDAKADIISLEIKHSISPVSLMLDVLTITWPWLSISVTAFLNPSMLCISF